MVAQDGTTVSLTKSQLLALEMFATADALRSVRTRLLKLVAEGHFELGFGEELLDIAACNVHGLEVAQAMERLASSLSSVGMLNDGSP